MVDRSKIIFVNADGDFQETSSADSLQFASYKTATYELTDALLGDVVNKMIKSDGSRAFTADQSFGGFKLTNLAAAVSDSDGVNYGQVKSLLDGLNNKKSCRVASTANINLASAPTSIDGVTLSSGDRVLVKDQSVGSENGIYVFNGGASAMTRAEDADTAAEITAAITTVREGSSHADTRWLMITDSVVLGTTSLVWDKWYISDLVGGDGISISGDTVAADLAASGGLKFSGGQIAVEVADFAGDGLVDDGSDNLAIDWASVFTIDGAHAKALKASDLASTTSGKGAKAVGLNDAGGYTNVNNVEDAIQELYAQSGGISFTVGTGGVAKGDLVYMSANDTVVKMPINALHRAIGAASATAAAAASVQAQSSDYVLTGVLSAAVAGARYYWDGSALSTTMPSASGAYVWQVGIAKNATDLLVAVEFIKKNA